METANSKNLKLDRRIRDRLPCTFEVEYQIAERQGLFHAKTLNISSEAINIIVNTSLKHNEAINLFFPFQSGTQMIPAKVIRIEGREIAAVFSMSDTEADFFIQAFNEEYKYREQSSFLQNCN